MLSFDNNTEKESEEMLKILFCMPWKIVIVRCCLPYSTQRTRRKCNAKWLDIGNNDLVEESFAFFFLFYFVDVVVVAVVDVRVILLSLSILFISPECVFR